MSQSQMPSVLASVTRRRRSSDSARARVARSRSTWTPLRFLGALAHGGEGELLVGVSAEYHDGQVGDRGGDGLEGVQALAVGEGEVEEDEVDAALVESGEAVGEGFGLVELDDGVVAAGEGELDKARVGRVVFHQEDVEVVRQHGLLGWESDGLEPEVLDGADDVDELGQVDRFDDVAVGVEVVGLADVGLSARGGEDHYWYALEFFIILNLGQDFAPVFPREVEVQQDEVGAGCVLVGRVAPEEGHGLLAVAGHAEVLEGVAVGEDLAGEANIGLVVLNEQGFEDTLWVEGRCHAVSLGMGSVK
jgi:hypothetical protein